MEGTDGHRARGTETGTGRRDVAHGGNLDPAIDAGQAKGFANQFVADLVDRIDHFRARPANAQLVVEAALDGDKDVLVNGGSEHTAAMFEKVTGKICSSAEQAGSKRSLNNDHTCVLL